MSSLLGRRALVTGASRNLGAEIASQLAAAGASVAVNFRSSEEEANRVVESLHRADGARHVALRGDVTNPEDIEPLVDAARDRLGGHVDVLINNAGPYLATPFLNMDVGDFESVLNANLRSVFLLVRAVEPGMRKVGWGRVINISASSAYVRNRSIYTLANAAAITLTEQLAVELAPGILVNAVAPGQIHESLEELRGLAPEWAAEVVRRTPLGRLATRLDIARIVVELCGPAFEAVTGVTVPVDGGLRLKTLDR